MIHLNSLISALKEPVLVLDRERTIIEAGGGIGEMGYRRDFLVGKSIDALVAPPFRRPVEATIDTAFRLGKPTSAKVEILNASSESIPVEMRVSPLEDKGHVRFAVLLYPNSRLDYDLLKSLDVPVWITDRKGNLIFRNDRAARILQEVRNLLPENGQEVRVGEEEFIAKVREVVDGFRRVRLVVLTSVCAAYNPYIRKFAVAGILSALVSHDVKNAIASLMLLTDLIEDESLKTRIYNGIRRVYHIHQRILNLARGRKELEEVPLKDVLEDVEEDLRPKLIRKNVKIVRDFPEDFTIRTDRNALYEILLNLVSNAIDASTPGGEVIVSAGVSHNVSLGRLERYVSVRDFGPGIPPERVRRIFNLFFTSKREGSGLGLFIVKTLSESIGARVSVRSEPGKGAEFVVFFPEDEAKGSNGVSGAGPSGSS